MEGEDIQAMERVDPGAAFSCLPLTLGTQASLIRISVSAVYKATKAGARTLTSPSNPCLDQVWPRAWGWMRSSG